MYVGGPFFILSIIAMGIGAVLALSWMRVNYLHMHPHARRDRITTWIRAMQGHDDDVGDGDERKIALLSAENEKLVGRIGRLEERIAVIERIVTDPGHATARAIEELR